jgi:hypothetical protein
MIEKIGRFAETLASNVSASRRGFLGQLGKAALGVAGLVGGLLAVPKDADAGGTVNCCRYVCSTPENRYFAWTCQTSVCPPRLSSFGTSCSLSYVVRATACSNCPRR